MFKKLSDAPIAEVQNAQVAKWKEEDLLTKCVTARDGATPFVFYEGPPTANGKPGIHHVMARTIKDVFCRYKTQQGYLVHRKAGWDTHGLPVELGVEKKLGITKEDIGKKITVVREVCTALGLKNVTPINARVESLPQKFDFVVSRAVTDMKTFTGWIWNKIAQGQRGTLPNGILYLKGGDLAEELALTGKRWNLYSISNFYEEEFFDTKKVVYTPRSGKF